MERSTRIPELTWLWAWRLFARWSRLDLDARSLTGRQRWSVVAITTRAVLKSRYLRTSRLCLLARTPAWIVARRLQGRTYGWYRVPTPAAAEHVRLRFDIWPLEVGDYVQVSRGRLTALGYDGKSFCEIIYVLPNGELEPDPESPEMSKAWTAFAAGLRFDQGQ